MTRPLRIPLLALFAFAPLARSAAAQDAKAGSVLAYDEAEQLMAQGKISEACPRYAESLRLDQQLGTLLHLADCLEQNGQTASAWASFREAVELAEKKGDQRREVAEQRVQALVPRLSRLQINVRTTGDLHVERDSVVVGSALWSVPVPTDPGPHTISAAAAGFRTWTGKTVVPADGSITVVDVPALEKEVPTSPESSVAPTTATHRETEDSSPPGQSSFLADRWPALTAGAVGIIGVTVGSIFGFKSMSKHDDAEQHCTGAGCDAEGVALKDDAIAAGNVSTAMFVVGGVGLAAGAVLWFALPPKSSSAAVSPGGAPRLRVGIRTESVTLEGRW